MNATNNAALRMEVTESVRRDGVAIGRVVSTTGSQIVALLDGDVGDPNVVQMGSLVSVCSPQANVYGIIAGLSTPAANAWHIPCGSSHHERWLKKCGNNASGLRCTSVGRDCTARSR